MKASHGTEGGYAEHRRLGEDPCDACRTSHTQADRRRRPNRAMRDRAYSRAIHRLKTLYPRVFKRLYEQELRKEHS